MIFIGGIHGVGKSFFCALAKDRYGVNTYSSGVLIAEYKKTPYLAEKKVDDVADNQNILQFALQKIEEPTDCYLLDGHFCLLDKLGQIKEIEPRVFEELKPKALLVLTALPGIISDRLNKRDGISYSVQKLEVFQNQEILYAQQIALNLGIPIKICSDSEKGLEFIGSLL